MSLLADLLSKKNNTAPSGGKDIPPTLTRSHDTPVKVLTPKSRYITIAAVSVTAIAVGLLAISQFGRLTTLLAKKPAPAPPAAVAPAVPSPQAAIVPPLPTPIIASEKPPLPEPLKKTAAKHKAKRAEHAQRKPAVRAWGTPRLAAIQPLVKSPAAKQAVPATPHPEAAAPAKIDTAKRDALLYAARSAEQASDWRLALANYRRAQKIDPDNFVIMNNAAAALNNLGMFDEGVREAKRALGKKPDYVPAMINAAIAYSSKGNSQEALHLFSEATLADPGNRSLVINLGILQERSGKLDDAQRTYRPLADDGDPLALQGMGRVYERKGNRVEAIRAYRQIMALPNANPALKKEIRGKIVRLEE